MLLSERPNLSQLKSFSIYGLFGFKDVKIPFDKEAVILIAENGAGKTTILNALYYSITGKFDRLSTIDFESVNLEFTSGVNFEIKKEELFFYNKNETKSETADSLNTYFYILGSIGSGVEKSHKDEIPEKIRNIINLIKKNLHESILYFPTYRRIEEDIKNLGYEKRLFKDSDDRLIQFGMDDVIAKINKIEENIREETFNLLPKVNGEMLTQFVEGITPTKEMRDSIQPETLSIVLSRVGDNISQKEKNKIEKLVNSGEINTAKYDQLVYFLSKLLSLYEQQKEKDDSIKQFAKMCNKYLTKKQIIYDEPSTKISIVQKLNNKPSKPIDIRNLSSGEKQIISLFSKIYLESENEYIILFDEPELSLSLEWQKHLLPDILNSGKCRLLVAVTHSPFIFDNELDANAIDLDDFVTER
ncbi:MAG TPA: AAA family ATPase [Nostocaceae cyanobacterium]|nr:AAA family ATPase [Nostocaceae cyanobacterium]